jgi:transposase InsO family protein
MMCLPSVRLHSRRRYCNLTAATFSNSARSTPVFEAFAGFLTGAESGAQYHAADGTPTPEAQAQTIHLRVDDCFLDRYKLIHHSDRGSQYAGDYRKTLKAAAIIQSMSRKANCWDSALRHAETALAHQREYLDRDSARRDLFAYFEGY